MMKTRQNIFLEGLAVSDVAMVSLLTQSAGNLVLRQGGAELTNIITSIISRPQVLNSEHHSSCCA